ncbi:MAG TPA: Gmad2 immunoglobulin-like domain-containing protein [Dermatophilaceae bacterium]|nr:Gmad2 immunoglobulin-like domain-containing protein [Dermatophilaceae bacterium]HOR14178.1 Gmad2 immunoglobulin-like domain-containing protein [Dermatophilaceae bacterium]HOU99655.1 Gmad2 immunoglobulin-like domain-containing protein [Dermatophilaceae bacterium]HPK87964.1 Gmad2 immunoglobulin-like domain-containing protein [Dermatophilaceae bacterium]HQG11529.1 Gmad2 immunoglobulin-like domain-containing protein [Dermatophilaceae bacterium]
MTAHPPGDPHVEARLRDALTTAAERVSPTDRLGAITEAVSTAPPRAGTPRWLLPLAASFLVLAVGLGALTLQQRVGSNAVAASGTHTAVVIAADDPLPAPSRALPASPGASTPGSTSATRFEWSAPVYYAAPGTPVVRWALYRDFVRATMGDDGIDARVTTAVNLALAQPDVWGQAMPGQDGYLRAWTPGTRVTASVAADRIALTLSAPGVGGLDADAQRMAVQALVWTATAAAQRNVPVAIDVAGAGPVVGGIPAGVFRRPADTTRELAPVWITSPGRFASVWDSRVVIEGQACTFEGTVQWELRLDGAMVRQGFTTATAGCPVRGTWRVDLGVLAPGRYTIRAFESDAATGGPFAEQAVAFTVR